MERSFFDVLPSDLLYILSDYLTVEDLHNAAEASKTWHSLISHDNFWRRRYQLNEKDAAELCSRFLTDKNCKIMDGRIDPIKRLAVDMSVTWLNGNFLSREDVEGLDHQIVRLNHVCFLSLTTSFEVVIPGTYNVWWRIRLDNPMVFGTSWIRVKDSKEQVLGQLSLTDTNFKNAWRMFGNEWFYLRIENIQVLCLDALTITFQSEDSAIWKRGICWDFVDMTRSDCPDRLLKLYKPSEREITLRDTSTPLEPGFWMMAQTPHGGISPSEDAHDV